jgi:hypothetical protein
MPVRAKGIKMNWRTYLINFVAVIALAGISSAVGADETLALVFYIALEVGAIKARLDSK